MAINGQLDMLTTMRTACDRLACAGIAERLQRYGLDADPGAVALMSRKVALLERQGWLLEDADASFVLLALKQLTEYRPWFVLDRYSVLAHGGRVGETMVEAAIKLQVDGAVRHVVREGRSAIDALSLALGEALRSAHPGCGDIVLNDYTAHALDGLDDPAAAVHVRLGFWDRALGRSWGSVAVAGDMVRAALLALVDAFEFKRWLDMRRLAGEACCHGHR